MNYPSLSLKQDLIDGVFHSAKYGIQKKLTPSERLKKYRKKKIELRSLNVVVEECDQCEFKTSKYKAMYRHQRENHTVSKQNCTECEFSSIYPNRVKRHHNHVHMGMKRKTRKRGGIFKCRRPLCEYTGTTNCPELENHSLFLCEQCQLLFQRCDDLKFHEKKIHEGLVFNCEFCEYLTARKSDFKRHIVSQHSGGDIKQERKPTFCQEEGCTYIDLKSNGQLKGHIETKHEGIVRFKCHIMNCSFRSTEHNNLRRHGKTHTKELLVCEACDVKVETMRLLKRHVALTHMGSARYICKFENCNFETHLRRSLTSHIKRCCKYQDSKSDKK